jgi:hypothetical protein
MLAAQVNARKHDNLRMILGIVWIWGIGLCEALLGWVLVAAAAAGRASGRFRTEDPSPPFACWRELWVPLALCAVCVRIGRRMDARRIVIVFGASGGPLCRM